MDRLGFLSSYILIFHNDLFFGFLIKWFLLPYAHLQNDLLLEFIIWVLLPSFVVEEAEQE